MKKKNFNGKLNLSKKTISNLEKSNVVGGNSVQCNTIDDLTCGNSCAFACITYGLGGEVCHTFLACTSGGNETDNCL